MNLVHYNPQSKSQYDTPAVPRLFGTFFDDFFTPFASNGSMVGFDANSLKVDIYEKDDNIMIDAELPGVKKEDISVDVKGKLLTLSGESKSDNEIQEENCYRRERRYGRVERSFNLPFEVDSDAVQATYTDGILKLTIPKPVEQSTKKIAIN